MASEALFPSKQFLNTQNKSVAEGIFEQNVPKHSFQALTVFFMKHRSKRGSSVLIKIVFNIL